MTFVAVLIKLTSKGPILTRQEEIGEEGRIVALLRFRSMTVGKSPRVTELGYWLRRMRLDELPMFWSVLVGDYSFFDHYPKRV